MWIELPLHKKFLKKKFNISKDYQQNMFEEKYI